MHLLLRQIFRMLHRCAAMVIRAASDVHFEGVIANERLCVLDLVGPNAHGKPRRSAKHGGHPQAQLVGVGLTTQLGCADSKKRSWQLVRDLLVFNGDVGLCLQLSHYSWNLAGSFSQLDQVCTDGVFKCVLLAGSTVATPL